MDSSPITVLLIDEYDEDRAALVRCFEQHGGRFRVYEASSSETALASFRAVRPDCVVVELKFSDVIGMDLVGQLYAEMNGKAVPVFVWTRLIHTMLRKGASMLGVQGYFEKVKGSERRMAEAILAALGEGALEGGSRRRHPR
jgi:DNA-binding NarL/FixJ family response regulator